MSFQGPLETASHHKLQVLQPRRKDRFPRGAGLQESTPPESLYCCNLDGAVSGLVGTLVHILSAAGWWGMTVTRHISKDAQETCVQQM